MYIVFFYLCGYEGDLLMVGFFNGIKTFLVDMVTVVVFVLFCCFVVLV